MDVQVNVWGIVLAAISSMVVGMVWYSRGTPIGKEWIKLTKSDKKVARSLNGSLIVAFLMSLLLAYALAHITYLSYKFFGGSYLKNALSTAFWLWLGVALSRSLVHDSFEGRPYKLTAINTGNTLVTMLVMALVLGWAGI
jgi:hypothetical protein